MTALILPFLFHMLLICCSASDTTPYVTVLLDHTPESLHPTLPPLCPVSGTKIPNNILVLIVSDNSLTPMFSSAGARDHPSYEAQSPRLPPGSTRQPIATTV